MIPFETIKGIDRTADLSDKKKKAEPYDGSSRFTVATNQQSRIWELTAETPEKADRYLITGQHSVAFLNGLG